MKWFDAYTKLRQYSNRSRWSCAKYQVWCWYHSLINWPQLAYYNWKWKRFCKKNPKEAKQIMSGLEEVARRLDDIT